jgi:hypothetical protein
MSNELYFNTALPVKYPFMTENIQEVILLPGKFNVTYCESVYITVAGSYSHAMHDNIKIFFSMIFP